MKLGMLNIDWHLLIKRIKAVFFTWVNNAWLFRLSVFKWLLLTHDNLLDSSSTSLWILRAPEGRDPKCLGSIKPCTWGYLVFCVPDLKLHVMAEKLKKHILGHCCSVAKWQKYQKLLHLKCKCVKSKIQLALLIPNQPQPTTDGFMEILLGGGWGVQRALWKSRYTYCRKWGWTYTTFFWGLFSTKCKPKLLDHSRNPGGRGFLVLQKIRAGGGRVKNCAHPLGMWIFLQ